MATGIITDDLAAVKKDGIEIDATEKYVIPGLVDIHSHGAMGHDFCDADVEGLKAILEYEKSCGVTSYCPTSMTLP
ncbi:MAG: N-acetylglucosamine-6-phosphate deacetylase, partial [Lachnospiraceae bacterium]|nr:N-acetylglucosamine-6-phosphate deacetylase [Lachnospiraceae bacterium]